MTASEIEKSEEETALALGVLPHEVMTVTQDRIEARDRVKGDGGTISQRRESVPPNIMDWTFSQAREWLRRTRGLHLATREASFETACDIFYLASDSQRLALLADAQCSVNDGPCGILQLPRADNRSKVFEYRSRCIDAARLRAANLIAKKAREAGERGQQWRGDLFQVPQPGYGQDWDKGEASPDDSPIVRGARIVC